jgi:hypothetical protein
VRSLTIDRTYVGFPKSPQNFVANLIATHRSCAGHKQASNTSSAGFDSSTTCRISGCILSYSLCGEDRRLARVHCPLPSGSTPGPATKPRRRLDRRALHMGGEDGSIPSGGTTASRRRRHCECSPIGRGGRVKLGLVRVRLPPLAPFLHFKLGDVSSSSSAIFRAEEERALSFVTRAPRRNTQCR